MTRILVADDSEAVRRGIRHLLNQHDGWQVCGEAADGGETITKVRQLSPDVVVLDFAMPVMNGIEVARQIREEQPNIPIVLCSLYFDRQLTSLARDVGITSVLSKSNVRQVIKGVEAGLRGEWFTESQV